MRVVRLACAGLLFFAAARSAAQTDEERVRLMRETLSYTDVIDAFDGPDPIDLNVRLEYERVRERGAIYRERSGRSQTKVADSQRELSRIAIGVDLGLHRDLMFSVRMPLVLSDARALRRPGGRSEGALAVDLAGAQGAGTPLFLPPLDAPTRAGLDYIAFGGAYALLNQMRKPWLPTWVVRVEGRRALGTPVHPCRETAEGRRCGTLSGEDRDGDGAPDGTRRAGLEPGSSRGLSGLLLETRFSRRYRHFEPYAGSGVLVEWPSSARSLFPRAGAAPARPGVQTSAALGTGLIPWENRGTFQRIALDLRLETVHVGAGYDYSPLFDALGSASDPELARARYEGARGSAPGTSIQRCADANDLDCGFGERVPFTGVTRIASHLQYGGRLGVEVQAARYVRFVLGSALSWVTPHAISGVQACGSDVSAPSLGDDGRACTSGGVDARHRSVIDAPGRRFFLRDQLLLSIFAQATAMF